MGLAQKFLHDFPPPEYLDVKKSAVVFSDHCVRFLYLDRGSNYPVYHNEVVLESGMIELGQIKNEQKVIEVLSKELENLPTNFVNFSLPDEACYIFTVRVPVVHNKDIRDSVEFVLEENVPLPLADISFDFIPVSIDRGPEGPTAKVVVVAISTTLCSQYVSILKKAGLLPLQCLNESQAVSNAVIERGSTQNKIIINMHTKSAGIYVANAGVVEFSSVVPFVTELVSADISSVIKNIKNEVERALDYSQSKSGILEANKKGVEECVLCGEQSILKNLSKEICNTSNVSSSMANVWVNCFTINDHIPQITQGDSLRFSSAIGLLI